MAGLRRESLSGCRKLPNLPLCALKEQNNWSPAYLHSGASQGLRKGFQHKFVVTVVEERARELSEGRSMLQRSTRGRLSNLAGGNLKVVNTLTC